jgi:hypothetical protein
LSFKAPHVSLVSFAVEVLPTGIVHVMIVETDLHLNPKHPSFNRPAVEHLISLVQNYVQANTDGLVHARLVSTRSGEI